MNVKKQKLMWLLLGCIGLVVVPSGLMAREHVSYRDDMGMADVDPRTRYESDLLIESVLSKDSGLVNLVLGRTKDVDALIEIADATAWRERGAKNVFSLAVTSGDTEVVKALLDYGVADISEVTKGTPQGDNLLYWLVRSGDTEMVKFLLENGARVNNEEIIYGKTLLEHAVSLNNPEMIRLLQSHGAM